MVTTERPQIYVASLSDYNAGILHGEWIDATLEPDEIYEQVNAMLAKSPEFKRFPAGGPAEEWAIHDFEGFGGWRLSEYESFETVSKVAQAIEEHGEAFSAFLQWTEQDLSDIDDLGEAFHMHYRGEWESDQDFARQYVSDCGWCGVPPQNFKIEAGWRTIEVNPLEELADYLDWEKVARELFQHGNYTAVQNSSYKFYVFEREV